MAIADKRSTDEMLFHHLYGYNGEENTHRAEGYAKREGQNPSLTVMLKYRLMC